MKRIFGVLTLLLCLQLTAAATTQPKASTSILFYGTQIDFQYDSALVFDYEVCAKDRCLKRFYRQMEKLDYQSLLDQFEAYRKQYELTDWLYFKLIRQTMEQIYGQVETSKKEMLYTTGSWFFMSKAGYNTRLSNAALKFLFLYVQSDENLDNIPRIFAERKRFYNLTTFYLKLQAQRAVFRVNNFDPDQVSRSFVFGLKKLPKLPPQLSEKSMVFKNGEEEYQLQLQLDRTPTEVMAHYPGMRPMDYLEVPISETLEASLVPQLRTFLQGKTQKESLEILLSFTRTSFTYKWDWNLYDSDRPMIADELFFNEFSDHEDRCALFYHLVKELLDLPMIVISHFNHDLTIAVALDEVIGDPIDYKGLTFTVCDPTTPNNSGRLGIYPNGLRHKAAEVIGEYQVPIQDNSSSSIYEE
ncbi:MAG: hypothetical protein AAF990_21145 [Bacteroidota bacterium]